MEVEVMLTQRRRQERPSPVLRQAINRHGRFKG
jgi:hypothetical protein